MLYAAEVAVNENKFLNVTKLTIRQGKQKGILFSHKEIKNGCCDI